MDTIEQVLEWAEGHVENLAQEMYWESSDLGGYWAAADREAKSRIRARVTSAFAFLDQFTGTGSHWSEDARDVFNDQGRCSSPRLTTHYPSPSRRRAQPSRTRGRSADLDNLRGSSEMRGE